MSCKKCETKKSKITEIPGQVIELKNDVQTVIKKQTRGTAMKTLFKFIFKLIWKAILAAGATAGILFALNKFVPDVFDSIIGWFKDQRDD